MNERITQLISGRPYLHRICQKRCIYKKREFHNNNNKLSKGSLFHEGHSDGNWYADITDQEANNKSLSTLFVEHPRLHRVWEIP